MNYKIIHIKALSFKVHLKCVFLNQICVEFLRAYQLDKDY